MSDVEKTPNEQLTEYINTYMADKTYDGDELEIRFGTNNYNQITKTDFDNIIQKLKSLGFRCNNSEGDYTLNIINEYSDPNTGKVKDSNIRTTIIGINAIQTYCRENIIRENKLNNIQFLQKFRKKDRNRNTLFPINFNDFQFRVNYKTERDLTPENVDMVKPEILQLFDSWRDNRKIFRFIKDILFNMKIQTNTLLNLT